MNQIHRPIQKPIVNTMEHFNPYECEHTRKEIRIRRYSDNRESYWMQCIDCGKAMGTAIKKEVALEYNRSGDFKEYEENLFNEVYKEWKKNTEIMRQNQKAIKKIEDEIERKERKEEYHKYLQTEEWRKRRDLVILRAQGICEGCRKSKATEVHHKNYHYVKDEMLFDLVALCHECHRKIHNKEEK